MYGCIDYLRQKSPLPILVADLREMSLDTIGMAAHKLLPIATMTQMDSIEQLKVLAPENIHKMENSQIRGYVQVIITDLQGVLKEM